MQVRCVRLNDPTVGSDAQDAPKGWKPSPEEVRAGLKYIRDSLPPDSEELDQQEFCIVGRTSPSPIMGWPVTEIEKAIRRLNAIRNEADVEYFHPCLVCSLKPVLKDVVMPKMLRYARTHGLFVAGPAKVGKTPFVKIWGYLIDRYWQQERGISRSARLRRGKKIERFRSKAQDIVELLMLDDPILELIAIEAVMDFFELVEAGSGDGRYNDAKYHLNAPRALLTNRLAYDKEPGANQAFLPEHFFAMVAETFGHHPPAIMSAVFKRCISLIVCEHRVVLRLPSEDLNAPICVYTEDGIAKDFLTEEHKPYLNLFLQGRQVKFPGYDEKVEEEKAWAYELIDAAVPPDAADAHVAAPVIIPSIAPQVNVKREQLTDQQIAIACNEAMILEMDGTVINVEEDDVEHTLEEQLEAAFIEEGIIVKQEIPHTPVAHLPQVGPPRQLAADLAAPVFLGAPGHGYERKILTPVQSVNILLGKGLVEEVETSDTSLRFNFIVGIKLEDAVAEMISVMPSNRRTSIMKLYGLEPASDGQPDVKSRKICIDLD